MSSPSSPGRVPVNIVMRTRNRPLLLARAMDDVLAQSFAAWRLTVVNDGGAQDMVDALVDERSEAFGDRIHVIHNETSRGMEAAANQGVEYVDSDFVAVHDDDDTWAAGFLQSTSAWLAANPEASAVAVRTEIVWERIEGPAIVEDSREVFLPDRSAVTLSDLLRFNSCVPISMLYRADVLRAIGLFDETLEVTGDWEANVRLAVRGPIGFLGASTLAFWHQRPSSTGDAGNTVVTMRDDHRRFDALVRDRALREWTRENGTGLPLYLTRFADDRFDEIRPRLDDIVSRLDRMERMMRRWPFEMAKQSVRRLLARRGSR